MKTSLRWLPALALLAFAQPALADDPPEMVGRVAGLTGPVSFHAPTMPGWEPALLNEPVAVGDSVFSPPNSGARIEIGPLLLVLRSDSQIDLPQMDQYSANPRLDRGSVDFRISGWAWPGGFTVTTPQGLVRIEGDGAYRVSLSPDGAATRVSVWEGSASFDNGRLRMVPGQEATISPAGISFSQVPGEPGDLQRWAGSRYLPPSMTGTQELDAYGQWQDFPGYGPVWFPNVGSDWAPYQQGSWRWVEPWGWTWVDNAPWGFAPFHYGRWAQMEGRWAWVPGAYDQHPVYAPALVIFSGETRHDHEHGPGTNWVPLRPGDQFHPWYRASEQQTQRLNAPAHAPGQGGPSPQREQPREGRPQEARPQEAPGQARPQSAAPQQPAQPHPAAPQPTHETARPVEPSQLPARVQSPPPAASRPVEAPRPEPREAAPQPRPAEHMEARPEPHPAAAPAAHPEPARHPEPGKEEKKEER